ncbi:MAG: hypothetical protein CVT69_01615 [Actinobacteria bacterium HGW-Actinobacteria-9]|jgi:hypothetical protein|nr:MAG: hypothetical protein CVT69_01615 [Actinobacteria bacterium HGW-Actinobacteria-9]
MQDPFQPQQETSAEENFADEHQVGEGTTDLAPVESMTFEAALDPAPTADEPEPEATPVADGPVQDPEPVPDTEPAVSLPADAEVSASSPTAVTEAAVITTGDMSVGLGARVAWWPFLVLVALWVSLAAVAAYLLTQTSAVPAFENEYYPFIVLAGVVLTASGPVLAVVSWAISPSATDRAGMFVTSLVRAAAITLFGVLMWWGVLVAVDALRLGLIRL